MRIHRWFDVNQMLLPRMKSHHIKFALVATFRSRPNLNISADEVSSVFIPFGNELFEMIHKVLTLAFSVSLERSYVRRCGLCNGLSARYRPYLGTITSCSHPCGSPWGSLCAFQAPCGIFIRRAYVSGCGVAKSSLVATAASTACSAWMAVVSKRGTSVSSAWISNPISVQPRITPWVPCLASEATISR